ncbi:MAG: cation-translocating P-type ATPase [Balneolaceae bacterium]|jgi:Cu2+-exporting ATPase
MSKDKCTLCNLPTPDPPITDPEVEGTFCCTGCLQVHQLLQDLEPDQARHIRHETINRRHNERENQELPEDSKETFLTVEGMHCSTCESFIESISRRQEGIYKCEASYASELVKVYYDPKKLSKDALPALISKMGYKAHPMGNFSNNSEFLTFARLLLGGLCSIAGLIVYILVLYPIYITGHSIIPFAPVTQYFFIANVFIMTSLVLFFTGFPILRGAWVSLTVMKPNMDLLISIAALSAYLFSTGALLTGTNELYFDVTMAIVMVVSLGNFYEKRIKKDKNSLLTQLLGKRIKKARVRRNDNIATINLDELAPGDRVIVKVGERIPVDGTIIEGRGVVNEALITGESLPVNKGVGDRVVSGTILTQNALTIETDHQVHSTIEKMIRLMWDIQAGHSGKQRLADKIAGLFVPGVLLLAVATFIYQSISGTPPASSLLSALAVLIVSCPCALGLATPLAVASGLRDALKNNIIFKTGAVFEEPSNTDILAFDKTGTLTMGCMQLINNGLSKEALTYARAIEQYSSHPVAEAITGKTRNRKINVQNFRSQSRGVIGEIDDKSVFIGQPEWLIENEFGVTPDQWTQIDRARQNGHVATGIAWNGKVHSILTVGDQIRKETASFISSLKKAGKKVAIITGDSKVASRPLQRKLNPDYLFTGARPESKTKIIKKLKKFGPVTMIGDGSNDALALAEADLGIAFGDLTAIAAESAQIVIPGDHLQRISIALKAMAQTKTRIRQNLGWAFLYNITAVPLAIAGLINPLFAALAMAGSSLLVVINSSRELTL